MTNLDKILKSRDITWPTKVHLVKAMVFPVVMCGQMAKTILRKNKASGIMFPDFVTKQDPIDFPATDPCSQVLWLSSSLKYLLLLLLLSRFSRVRLCATPETAAHQAPPSLGFSRQEEWSGLPFPSPMHESEK